MKTPGMQHRRRQTVFFSLTKSDSEAFCFGFGSMPLGLGAQPRKTIIDRSGAANRSSIMPSKFNTF
jgi:hypothetical protein